LAFLRDADRRQFGDDFDSMQEFKSSGRAAMTKVQPHRPTTRRWSGVFAAYGHGRFNLLRLGIGNRYARTHIAAIAGDPQVREVPLCQRAVCLCASKPKLKKYN
jgi:hypothetical protein